MPLDPDPDASASTGGRRPRTGALLLGAVLLGCSGIARQIGESGAEGVLTATQEQAKEKGPEPAEPLTKGLIEGLSGPQQLRQIGDVSEAAVAGGLRAATESSPGVGGRVETAPIELVSAQAARAFAAAFSQELVLQLGTQGEGPLAQSLAATGREMSASAMAGASDELGALFPECVGSERARCIERRLADLSRAASTGVAEGFWDGVGLRPLVIGLVMGFALAVLVGLGLSAVRTHGPQPPRPEPIRQRQPT